MKEIEEQYPEVLVKFENDIKQIMAEKGIREEHAVCYLCNFEDKYICRVYNDGCKSYSVCKQIAEERLNV